MKIFRLSALILVLSLVLSVFAACGGDSSEVIDSATDIGTETTANEEATTEAPAPAEPVDPLLAKIAEKMKNDPNYVMFIIGDSLTQGSGASDPVRLDYTAKFAEKLADKFPEKSVYRVDGQPRGDYLGIQYPHSTKYFPVQRSGSEKITVVRCGIGGNTVQKIIDRSSDFIGKEIGGEMGDLFIIMSGINDYDSGSYDLSKYASPPKYKANLNTLVAKIREGHPDSDIILITPTTVGKDGKGLDIYAQQVIDVGASQGIAVIDQHKLWMEHYDESAPNYGQGDWLKDGDSCHPTDVGHEAIADEMIKCLFGK